MIFPLRMSEHGVIGVMCCDKQGLALEGKWVSRILTVLEVVHSWYICGLINEMRNFIEQSCLDHVTTGSPPICSAIKLFLKCI